LDCWRDGGRAKGRLKTGSLLVTEARAPMLGMPLTLLEEEATEVRLDEVPVVEGAVEGVFERTSEALDVFFCSGAKVCVGWLLRDKDDTEGFLRSCSVDAGVRSWDWLPVDLSTGRRDAGGLGMPEGRGMADGWWSMANTLLVTAALTAVGASPAIVRPHTGPKSTSVPKLGALFWTNCRSEVLGPGQSVRQRLAAAVAP
jgi:hypothetical protein